ncbi:hypothetical protein BCR32DRAFT_242048 [Anaeromyces robustus]|jgi:hypothetical protein|uniref:RING-type E3 ubiquitin transferase n=1 Tax=Anaeromyces robustus TaxID=1754192 RepID=A0A1Y1XHB7_9FUNG|nr:hypothetical protein BCR32DRAFT_242048 [Anaeromyces robustus]|eukprot:ORX85145.1 hypothetical protein BCR32DRAFT_242048 [Anaeromyces robustus]
MDCKEITWILFCIIWIGCCFIPSSEAYDDNLFSDSLIIIDKTNDTIQGRMAAFGPRIGEEGFKGVVISMDKIDSSKSYSYGCKSIKETTVREFAKERLDVEIPEDGYIALVERGGGCSFSDKVRNMQRSGAKAVIVGNNHGDPHLITMYASGDTSDIYIPSVFILQYDMFVLRSEPFDVTVIESESDWAATDIFIMTTILPVVFIIGIFVIYKLRVEILESDMQNESNVSLGAASQEEVDALPIKIFDMKKKQENDPETCAVCIDDFTDGDKLRVLPCHHEYHVECIDLWLTTRKRFCPICKRSITGEDDADENTPLLARSSSNTYNTGEGQNSSDSDTDSQGDESHVIDIGLDEIDNSEDEEVREERENENHEDGPTSQEESLILPNDDFDDPSENEPLINLVTRS